MRVPSIKDSMNVFKIAHVCLFYDRFSNALFDHIRYSDEQIPGVLYASVNPEYMTSTDGKG